MHNYWHAYYTDSAVAHSDAPLKQVGKTVNGIEVADEQIAMITNNVARVLGLTPADTLLDLCCGNGLLTVRLAECTGAVIGIDFTKKLVEVARERNGRFNLSYEHANVLALSVRDLGPANRFMMYEALQHFTPEQLAQLLHVLGRSHNGIRFFIGGIPDQRRLRAFYDTEEKLRFYYKREDEGRSHLGRWWKEEEIQETAARAGFTMKRLEQPLGLYTAYYRFDVLLTKNA
jgi:cyclopropane fatty-acyl-phospholipid synthase-like methyltransferase